MFTLVLQFVVVHQCWNVKNIRSNFHYITSNMSVFKGCCDNAKASYHSDDMSFMFTYVQLFVAAGRCRNAKYLLFDNLFISSSMSIFTGCWVQEQSFISTRFGMRSHVRLFVITRATRFLCSKRFYSLSPFVVAGMENILSDCLFISSNTSIFTCCWGVTQKLHFVRTFFLC